MSDQTAFSEPRNLHEAISIGIGRALSDLGADVSGCTPSMLSGHVIQELRRIPGWRPPARVVTTAEEMDALQPAQDVIDSGRSGANCWAAVICDAQGQVLTRDVDNLGDEVNQGRHAGWWLTGHTRDDIDSSTLTYPVTVLYAPTETGDSDA